VRRGAKQCGAVRCPPDIPDPPDISDPPDPPDIPDPPDPSSPFMKNLNILILIATFIVSLSSCKDDDPAPVPVEPTGTVYFRFDNVIDGQPVTYGDLTYTNEAGNVYSVDMLKYYISNIVFIKEDNTPVAVSNYELIDESLDTSQYFAVTLPAGNYKSFRFLMGVDSIKNVSGAQAGELDPSYGMFWDWNTGYIYFKHEGEFIDATGDTLPIVYHYGTVEALTTHEFNAVIPVSNQPRVIKMQFNLNKLYRSPNVVDFTNNNIHSGGSNWITTLRENLDNVFSLVAVE